MAGASFENEFGDDGIQLLAQTIRPEDSEEQRLQELSGFAGD